MNFSTNKKDIIFHLIIILVIFTGVIIRIISFNNNLYFIPLDDCHSLDNFEYLTLKECFTRFIQGANFLPLYKLLLFVIYKLFGFNFFILKLPSLISSILILPLSFSVLKKLFNNKLIIISILIILAFNHNLIYFATRIKPYELDVFITLIILNSILSLNNNISLKQTIKYSIASIPTIFLSIPSIILIELYWFIIYIKNIILKNKSNIKNLLIFQLITITFIFLEYLTYINQIKQDTNLQNQWIIDSYYYAPKSLEAVNSLIQYIYFKFFWWDTVGVPSFHKYTIILALFIFLLGCIICVINSIKSKNLKDIFLVSPVLVFLVLSYMNVYPFCNRIITFLIPIIIFITFKPFDFKSNKIVFNFFIIIYLSLFIKHINTNGEIHNLMFNDSYNRKTINIINTLENTNPKNETVIVYDAICAPCLGSNNIKEIKKLNINDKNITIQYFDKRKNEYFEINSLKPIFNNSSRVYFAVSEDCKSSTVKIIENSIKKLGYELKETKQSPFINYKLFQNE